MEQATLRPVPLRPAGPVDPAEALAHVLGALPDLDEQAAQALSLIEIAGRTRDQAVEETGLSQRTLAAALYRARKALRRSMFPLSASGWCERAEMLLSERLDGVLVPPGPARLDVHLRNCERCVDHERRLSQAREKLVREFIDAHPESAGAGPAERPAAAATLRVVEPVTIAEAEPEPRFDGPTRTVAGFAGPTREPLPADAGDLPELSFAGPGGQAEIRAEIPRRAAEPDAPVAQGDEPDPHVEEPDVAAPAAAVVAAEAAVVAAEAAVVAPEAAALLVPSARSITSGTVVWGALTLLSVGLAAAALIIVILALSGMERVF